MKTPSIKSALAPTDIAPKHILEAISAIDPGRAVRLNVEIPFELHNAVKIRAIRDGKSLKEAVIDILNDYIK